MRFDQVILSGQDDIVLFDRNDPLSSPYVTRTIDGLGPTEATVNLAQDTTGAGVYLGRRPSLREIVCNIHMNPDYTIGENPSSLRDRLYLLRSNELDGSLSFRLMDQGAEVARTPVYIKRMETTPFAKENLLQLVLSSPEANFHADAEFVMASPTFDKQVPGFPNGGSAPVGFRLKVGFYGAATMFSLTRHGDQKSLAVVRPFSDGDILEIDTRLGSRGVWVENSSGRQSLLGFLGSTSTWLTLFPGVTQFTVSTGGGPSYNFNWLEYRHRPEYLGV